MDRIREIAKRGWWESGVYDRHPKVGPRRIRVAGKFATEGDAIAKAMKVIADGRPDIATFIHRETAKPSISFNLSQADLDEIGRALTGAETAQLGD